MNGILHHLIIPMSLIIAPMNVKYSNRKIQTCGRNTDKIIAISTRRYQGICLFYENKVQLTKKNIHF